MHLIVHQSKSPIDRSASPMYPGSPGTWEILHLTSLKCRFFAHMISLQPVQVMIVNRNGRLRASEQAGAGPGNANLFASAENLG